MTQVGIALMVIGATVVVFTLGRIAYHAYVEWHGLRSIDRALQDAETSDDRRSFPAECVCGRTMSDAETHRVIAVSGPLSDQGFQMRRGEGTAMVAEFCGEHCPGNCNRKHEKTP